jgi:hypothetical protein
LIKRRHSAIFSFAVASLVLAGWLISLPLEGQSTRSTPPAANQRSDADEDPASGRESERDDVRGREEWFYRQRRYPLAAIPGGARLKALARKEEMRRAQRELAISAAGRNARVFIAPRMLASTTTWTPIGPAPTVSSDSNVGLVSGRVTGLAVDPTNSSIVYAGGAQGGVWKSTDAGAHWKPTFDAENTLAVGSIAIDPSSCAPGPCTTLYVGTGEQNFSGDSYYGAGIYKSTDGGATWTQIPGETITNPQAGAPNSFLPPAPGAFNQLVGGVHIGAIVVHPAAPTRIFAAVQIFENVGGGASSGLYCSDDSGATWTQVISGAIGTDVAIHPAGTVGYAALGSNNGDTDNRDTIGQNGVYKSTNVNAPCASQTWTPVSKAPVPTGTAAGMIRLGLAPSDAAAKTLYAAVANPISTTPPFNTTLAGVFRTVDGGTTWTNVTPPHDFCMNQCDYDLVLKVHPTDPNTVFAGGSGVFNGGMPYFLLRTNNGLSASPTWTQIAQDSSGTLLHVDQHAIAFGFSAPNAVSSIFVGTDGGVWSSPLPAPSSPITWTDLNQTLQLSQFYPGISIDPTTANLGYGGTQDNGTQKYAAAQQWAEQAPCGDGGYTAIDASTPSTVYAACQNIHIRKSLDSGADNFSTVADSGINQSDRVEFIAPLVIDPVSTSRLYFGTFRVWQTLDGAMSWTAISPDLTAGPANAPDLTSLSVSSLNSDVVYAGTFDSKVWRTTNASAGGGATWTELDGGTLPPRAITEVVADPHNQDTVFVTVSGFSGFQINPPATDTQGHVFRCSATQSTCTDISGTGAGALPNVPVNAIVVDPIDAISDTLYIGTDVGVFASTDGGTTWQPDYPGMPNGLPNVAVLSLTLQPTARILRAGTHGRGAWDLQLNNVAPLRLASLAPASASVTATNLTLTLNGGGFTPNSTVLFNNTAHVPASQSATQLTINLTASDLSNVGPVSVQVSDPTATPPMSNALTFTVTNDFSLCVGASAGMACPTTGSGSTPRGVALITPLTIAPAQSAPFPASVVFSCSGLPNEASCNFTSTAAGFVGGSTGTLPASAGTMGNTQVAVSFMTTAPSLAAPRFHGVPRSPLSAPPLIDFAWGALLLALVSALIAANRQRSASLRWALAALLILAFAGMAGACGGSSGSGGGGGGVHDPGTTPGPYSITVTATSGAISHAVTYTLTVTQ